MSRINSLIKGMLWHHEITSEKVVIFLTSKYYYQFIANGEKQKDVTTKVLAALLSPRFSMGWSGRVQVGSHYFIIIFI
jgi:hypothetical protein